MVDSRVDGTDGTPHNEGTEAGTLTILSKGSTIYYVIPSFPVYSAELIKVESIEPDGSVHMFDAFAVLCKTYIYHKSILGAII